MTKYDKTLLIGIVYGDGCIRQSRSELIVVNYVNQTDLIHYKAKILTNIVSYQITVHQYGNRLQFSVQNKYFQFLRKWCYYANGDRKFSKKVLNRLNEEAIAIWYMDDGSLHAKKQNGKIHAYELTISCCAKNEKDAQNIVDVFLERFDIKFTVKRNKGLFSVRCGTKEARKFIKLVEPYIVPSLLYKVQM